MKAFVVFLVLQIVYYELIDLTEAGDDDCKTKRSHLPRIKLKKDLLCDYEKDVIPRIKHQNETVVSVRMILKSFEFNMHSHTMEVNNWLAVSWKDDHLRWSPEEYENIEKIHLSSDEIWVPDLSIYNRANQAEGHKIIGTVECLVYNTGTVVCVPPTQQNGLCIPNLEKYPFDTQNCTLRFGSWVHNGEELNIKFNKIAVSKDDLTENPEFELLKVTTARNPGIYKCCPNNTYPSLNYHFIIKRHSASITAVYVVPALVLIFLTLTTLWLNIESVDRLTVCCCNIIIHFLYIQSLWWTLPSGGKDTPLVFTYSRDSLLLAAFTLITTVLLRTMQGNKEQTPNWVSSTVSGVMGSRPGKVLFLFDTSMKGMALAKGDEDAIKIVENSETTEEGGAKDWILFAKVIDKLCFVAYFVVYVCMFIAFVP